MGLELATIPSVWRARIIEVLCFANMVCLNNTCVLGSEARRGHQISEELKLEQLLLSMMNHLSSPDFSVAQAGLDF